MPYPKRIIPEEIKGWLRLEYVKINDPKQDYYFNDSFANYKEKYYNLCPRIINQKSAYKHFIKEIAENH